MTLLRPSLILILSLILVSCANKDTAEKKVTSDQAAVEEPVVEEATRPITAEKLDLNSATKEEFMTIKDVGERMAHEFDEYRPYVSIVQFRREMAKYVDDAQIEAYEEHVYVPIDINESDAETVAQILGLDLAGAEALVAGRPYENTDAFYSAVTEVAGGIASQFAKLYVSE